MKNSLNLYIWGCALLIGSFLCLSEVMSVLMDEVIAEKKKVKILEKEYDKNILECWEAEANRNRMEAEKNLAYDEMTRLKEKYEPVSPSTT